MHAATHPIHRNISISVALTFALALPAWASRPPRYEYAVLDLGTLTGRGSNANAISHGYLAGSSPVSGNYNGEPWFNHACRWENNVIQDLGVLGADVPPDVFPKPQSEALGVNSGSRVVGRSAQPFENWKAFLWLPESDFGLPAGMNALPDLSGDISIAHAINDQDWIVGESRYMGAIGPRPVLWRYEDGQWTITDLGTLGGPYGAAGAINALGQIAGSANTADGDMRAFIWLPAAAYGLSAGIHALDQNLPQSVATTINNKGQIAGYSGLGAPWLWLPEADYGLSAGIHWLDASNVENVSAVWPLAVGDDGAVTGQLGQYFEQHGHGYTEYHAFIWRNGLMQRIEDLLPRTQPWWLVSATGLGEYRGSGPSSAVIASSGVVPDQPDLIDAVRIMRVHHGDVNCDGMVDFRDVDPFLLAIDDPAGYAAAFPECTIFNADTSGDGYVDFRDIPSFLRLLFNTTTAPAPAPVP